AQIDYVSESVEGGHAFVSTTIARRNGGQIHLDYRMLERDGRWKVRDVIVDGVSVAANYRAQIERVLEVASLPELLGQMRDKVGRVEPPLRAVAIVEAVPRAETVTIVEPVAPADTATDAVAAVHEASPPAPMAEPVPAEAP